MHWMSEMNVLDGKELLLRWRVAVWRNFSAVVSQNRLVIKRRVVERTCVGEGNMLDYAN